MKKIILSVIVLMFSYTITHAQGGIYFIAKGGANFSKIAKQNFNTSYHAGVSIEWDISKKVGIQPEILFSQLNSSGSSGNKDSKLNYLSIPLLLRVNVTKKFTINLGPEYSILMDSKNTIVNNAGNAFKSGNFSVIAGMQLEFNPLRIYARYDVGMSDIGNLANQSEWKSQIIQVGIGLRIL
ncbi:MAG: porin family protein [Chitinophagaceae bacterium]|nr:porin family protein [Chitinophagaceae bacterium]MCW5906210.1 porin family protein [Chitinophagaceae bacterium]